MISFIIPTYNEEKAIEETILKLKNNFNLVPYEIIVTDDGSTDRTVKIAAPLADRIVTGPKLTIAANRNRGAKEAKYPFIVFMDCGVRIPEPNTFIQNALSRFEGDKKLAGLTVRIKIEDSVRTFADSFFMFIVDLWFNLNINFLGMGFASGKFQMVKAEVFREAGGYNEKLVAGEDSEFFHRLAKKWRTRWARNLTAYHLGRREHALGWPRILALWMTNGLSMIFLKRSVSKEWEAIR